MINQANNPFFYASGPPPPAPTDPYYDDVSLLLHCDGTNGSTTFTDSSRNAFTVTPNGSVQITTSTKKFGTGSALFGPGIDYITTPSSSEWTFGYGDFTVEYWIKTEGTSLSENIMGIADGWNIVIYYGQIYWQTVYASSNLYNVNAASIRDNNWHHVAHCRSGNTHRIFFDGIIQGTYTDNTNYTGNAGVGIGYSPSYNRFYGHLDDIRITKGVARYTAAFTPPTQAFPDSSDGGTNFSYVNSVYKQYNISTVTTPSGIIDNDICFHIRADSFNSTASSYNFTELQNYNIGAGYWGNWYRIASSLPSTLTLPNFSYGSLSFLRKMNAGSPSVVNSNFQYTAATTSITCPAITGTGMLLLIVEAYKNNVFVANHPTGWFLQSYISTWLGGNYSNCYVYKKINDEQPITFTTNTTCDIAAAMILLN